MDATALFKLSYGLYITGVKNGDGFGGSIVDALMQATASDPPHIILGSMNGNHTTKLIREQGEFTVSVLGTDVNPFVIANFGYQSARDTDKWANVPYDIKDGLPVLTGCVSYFRCKVEDMRITDTHHIFTGTALDAWHGSGGEPLIYADYFKGLKNSVMKAFQEFKATGISPLKAASSPAVAAAVKAEAPEAAEKKWVCTLCGYVYEGKTPFEELPGDWACPLCGAPKSAFELQ